MLNRSLERDTGDYSGEPKDPVVKPPSKLTKAKAAKGESVMEQFEIYATENSRQVKPDTLSQSKQAARLFSDFVGASFPAANIDRKTVREFKTFLMQMPVQAKSTKAFKGKTLRQIVKANETLGKPAISPKTVNRYLAGLGALCEWLVRNDTLESNPVHGMLQAFDRKKRTTLPFTIDQMNQLFASPMFTGCKSEKEMHIAGDVKIRDHRFWLPLVMLFSGARPAEIAQLNIADIKQQHSHWVMHITDLGDDEKSVKTSGSNRVVPIHPELIKLGFIAHYAAMKAKGEKRLFPEAERNERGQMAAKFSREFPRYLQRIGIRTGKEQRLYSFRHGFIDALRRAGFLDEQFGYLVGHSNFSTTELYGTLPQGMLEDRVRIVNAVRYDGLKLLV